MSLPELHTYALLIVSGLFARWLSERPDVWAALGFSPSFEGRVALLWWGVVVSALAWMALTIRVFHLTIPVAIFLLVLVAACVRLYLEDR